MGTKSIKAMNSDEFLSFLDEALSTKTTKSAEAAFYSVFHDFLPYCSLLNF